MEMDYQPTAGSNAARVGAGVRPAARTAADVAYQTKVEAVLSLASCDHPPGRGRLGLRVIVLIAASALSLHAQSSSKTVRHHKVAVDDPSSTPELLQAESAIEKQDYVTAEPLLKKVVGQDPENYAAWFDLGFLYNALGKTEDSIAAYRKAVAAKPGVFESNLNLGLMLVRAHQPDAEQFLRAATKLKPTAQVAQGQARAWLSLGHLLETSNPEGAIEAFNQAA